MEIENVLDNPRTSKGRVSFDFGCLSTPPENSDNPLFDCAVRSVNKDKLSKTSRPDDDTRIHETTISHGTDPSSSSSASFSDERETSADLNVDYGYIVVGNHKRRMSNTVMALDLDLFRQRKRSNDRRQSGSVSNFRSNSPPTANIGNWNYFSHSPMIIDGGGAEALPSDTFWPMTSTDQVLGKQTYKVQLALSIQKMDQAFQFLNGSTSNTRWRESILHGLGQLNSAVEEVWKKPFASDLAAGMADHLRSSANLDTICRLFVNVRQNLWKESGKTIENYFSDRNRGYILQQPWFNDFLAVLMMDGSRVGHSTDQERDRLAASLLESLVRHGPDTCRRIAGAGGLDFLLLVCRREWGNGGNANNSEDSWETMRDAASALCNLAVLGGREVRKAMVEKNIPSWMFVLLSHKDTRISYYACLIVCVIANEYELEQAVEGSQTLPLVVSFMQTHQPADVAPLDVKYRSGRTKPWIQSIATMLRSSRSEVQALACFQLAKEAFIRRSKENGGKSALQIFEEVGALSILKDIAASPLNEMAANFAEQVLRIVGEVVPRKLNQSVPMWTAADVEFWITQIGFDDYAAQFSKYRVDGDLLLRTTDHQLIHEVGMLSEYERMRFLRELNSLKKSADYSCVDPTRLDLWLMSLDKDLSVYTYNLLRNGVDRRTLIHVDDNILQTEGSISNNVHRLKILHAIKEVRHVDELDIALLRKQVDIFICYRRSTGSQLASLLKVHLQLRGYKVFIDVDRLYAGQFDTSLLKNVRAAKHFLLVLTPHSLDRCLDDHACKDWVHLEIRTALEFGRNIVPVQDKGFTWPEVSSLPLDIRPIAFFNAVQWVHEYQEACVEKLDRFLKGETSGSHEPPGHHATIQDTAGPNTSQSKRHSHPKNNLVTAPLVNKQMSENAVAGLRPSLKTSSTVAARLDSV